MAELGVDFEWDEDSFEQAFAELEQECTLIIRGLSVLAWNQILQRTPQFAGGMAASWSYSLNTPQFYDRSNMVDPSLIGAGLHNGRWEVTNPLRKGHPAAIEIANDDNVGSELPFKLGDTIYIANGVDHGEGPYSADVESGGVRLRAVNLPGAPVQRTMSQIEARWETDMSPQTADMLKQLRIGGSNAY